MINTVASDILADADLPEGWTLTRLGDLCEHPQYGWTTSAKKAVKGLRLLRTTDISSGDPDWATVPVCDKEPDEPAKYLLRKGDIVISRAGSVGISHLLNDCPPAVFASYLIRLRALPPIPPEFIRVFLRSPEYWTAIADNTAGIALQNINATKLRDLDLPLPPLAEQRRIVAKVEELLARVNVARERLAKVPSLLKRFRQSVLAAACSGQLTAEWRTNDEINENGMPASWHIRSIEDVCVSVVDCPHSTPKWTAKGEICLRTTNFKPGRLDLSVVRYVSPATYTSRISRLEPMPGDVVYSREGGILGIACLFPDNLRACLGQRMMLMRTKSSMQPVYLMHVLNSPLTLEKVRDLTGGTASPHLNVGDVKAFEVPLPPIEEQFEIVRRVESLFTLADKIESRVQSATARIEKITQAILAKAFRGELVPTEAELARQEGRDYEPASVLLERIRAERAQAEESNTTKPRRGRKTKQSAREETQPEPEDETDATVEEVSAEEPDEPSDPISRHRRRDRTMRATRTDDDSIYKTMVAFRAACYGVDEIPENEYLRMVGNELGIQRLGKNVRHELKGHLRAAIRRGIAARNGKDLVFPNPHFKSYNGESLLGTVQSVMKPNLEYTREEVVTLVRKHLGFQATTEAMKTRMKPIFNSGIRKGILTANGPKWISKVK